MTDEQVLNMPARRFWSMEGSINRVMAERDLRFINSSKAVNSSEANESVIQSLTDELGETCQIKRPKFVKPDGNAKNKFAQVMR